MRSLSGEVKGEQGRSKVSEERKGVRGSMDTKKESKTVIKYNMCFKSSTISFSWYYFYHKFGGKILMPFTIIFFAS